MSGICLGTAKERRKGPSREENGRSTGLNTIPLKGRGLEAQTSFTGIPSAARSVGSCPQEKGIVSYTD